MKNKPVSQSAFFTFRSLIGVVCLLGALLVFGAYRAYSGASASEQSSASMSKLGPLHKVSVTNPEEVQTLTSQGARVIADYGSFTLLDADESLVNSLSN